MPDYVVDFERCVGVEELKQTLAEINDSPRYVFETATQDGEVYTVFFRRYLSG